VPAPYPDTRAICTDMHIDDEICRRDNGGDPLTVIHQEVRPNRQAGNLGMDLTFSFTRGSQPIFMCSPTIHVLVRIIPQHQLGPPTRVVPVRRPRAPGVAPPNRRTASIESSATRPKQAREIDLCNWRRLRDWVDPLLDRFSGRAFRQLRQVF
jgi:hypothetical protein